MSRADSGRNCIAWITLARADNLRRNTGHMDHIEGVWSAWSVVHETAEPVDPSEYTPSAFLQTRAQGPPRTRTLCGRAIPRVAWDAWHVATGSKVPGRVNGRPLRRCKRCARGRNDE